MKCCNFLEYFSRNFKDSPELVATLNYYDPTLYIVLIFIYKMDTETTLCDARCKRTLYQNLHYKMIAKQFKEIF